MSLEFPQKMESTLPAEMTQISPEKAYSPTASMLCLRRAFIEELMEEEAITRKMAASSKHMGHFPKPRPASAQPANTQELTERNARPNSAPSLFHREEVEFSLPGSCESFIISSPKRCPRPQEAMTCFSSDGLHANTKTTAESHINGVTKPGQWEVNKNNNNTESKTKVDSPLESSNVQEKQEVSPNTESDPCRKQKKETPVHLFFASSVYPQNCSSLDKDDMKTTTIQKSQTSSDSSSGKASVKTFFKGLWKKVSSKNRKSSDQKAQCPSPSSAAQGPTAHLEFAQKMETTLPAENGQISPEREHSPTASELSMKRAFIQELMEEEAIRSQKDAASAQSANTQDLTQNSRPNTAEALFHREEVEFSLSGSCESFIISSPKREPTPQESMAYFSSDGLHTVTKTTAGSHINGVTKPGQWEVSELEDLTPKKTVKKKNNTESTVPISIVPPPPKSLPSSHLPPTPPPFSWDSPIAWLRAFYRYKKAKLLDYIYANYKAISITIIFCIGGLIVFFLFF